MRPTSFDPSALRQHLRRNKIADLPELKLVEDSRILEASIFSILHKSRRTTVVGRLLHDIITIADEVDSQLKQTMLSYTDRSHGTRSESN